MRGIARELDALGTLAIVGNGNVAQANDFDRTHGKGLRSLVDPDKSSYRALGFVRGLRATYHALAVVRGVRQSALGYRQGTTQGDAFQMGGTLVLAAGGRPVYFQRSAFAGDHPPLTDVLQAMREATALSAPGPKPRASRKAAKPAGRGERPARSSGGTASRR